MVKYRSPTIAGLYSASAETDIIEENFIETEESLTVDNLETAVYPLNRICIVTSRSYN